MRSGAFAELGASARAVATTAVASLWLVPVTGGLARAEMPNDNPAAPVGLGARGGLTPGTPGRATPPEDGAADPVEFSIRAGLASDYIYRGTTLSDHRPAVGAAVEAAFGMFYAGGTIASVKLPSRPAAEITMGAGIRPKLGEVEFDFGWTYFLYPGETPPIGVTAGIEYWEAVARADTRLGNALRVAGGFAYSPNVSNTGARSGYAAFGLGIDLPRNTLPQNITASLTAAAGYSWFGNQKAELGGFPLPAYLNWQAGVTFARGNFNLDLRYYDTNLSKEDCFVFTGDPNAVPGGAIDPVTNPQGLTSRWCSATFVAKLWFTLDGGR
jgi:uncharacterized protein (TIGR02001 family)